MKPLQTTLVLATAALLGACAGPMGPMASQPMGCEAAPPATRERMESMQVMRDKMRNAQSPAERQALMAEHMKAMHDGMDSMKRMDGMQGMRCGPTGTAPHQHQQRLEMRVDMMQTMMEMMMQRMPQ